MVRLTKKKIIDYIVLEATHGLFYGDGRDGKASPITLQNFIQETFRCGAKALRARLSGLSYQQVLQEGFAANEHKKRVEAQGIASLGQVELAKRQERVRANRRQIAAAMTAKRNRSQLVDDLVRELVGPVLNNHPKWASHQCAVDIRPQLNKALSSKGLRPLGEDAIRKRVQKYRTHAR